MFGDNEHDAQLKATWDEFCEQLKGASDLVFRDTAPTGDLERIKGFRLLARNIALGLQFELDNANPDYPELLHYFDPIRKQGGDNTDALYVGAPVNGEHTYRITGNKGTAAFFAVTVLEDGDTPWGGAVIGSLLGSDMVLDSDGNFELILSPDPPVQDVKNWIQTTPGTWRLTFRQFFADWENEVPMVAHIERLTHAENDENPTLEVLKNGLSNAAEWVHESTHYWAYMIDKWQAQPNKFLSYRQLEDNAIDATPGGEPLICYWHLPKDEVLVLRVTPPEAEYWAIEFGSYWWETMDYRYRLCNTNNHYARLQENGELVVVVSHNDPGVWNWLDPSGHSDGYITMRWLGSDHYPIPTVEQAAASDLEKILPSDIARISVDQRREQIAQRRRGVVKRFGT